MLITLFNRLSSVKIGSYEHFLPILFAVVFTYILIKWAKTVAVDMQTNVFKGLGIFVTLTVIVYHSHLALTTDYNFTTDLPLFLCSFLGLIIVIFTQYRTYWMYETLLFWVFAGTTQAILTPDIPTGFPTFNFFRYWIVHLGLITIMLYATVVFRMRPTIKSVFKSFVVLQIYMVIILIINTLLGSNYSYLNRKPTSASALDYLGDWPQYIVVVEVLLIPYFLLIYLPFYIIDKRKSKR